MSTRSKRSAAAANHEQATPVKMAKLNNLATPAASETKNKQKTAGAGDPSAHAPELLDLFLFLSLAFLSLPSLVP